WWWWGRWGGGGWRMAPSGNLPRFGWIKRWLGRRHSDGRDRLRLWLAEGGKPLVSHQSPCCHCLRAISQAGARSTEFVSCGQLRDCRGPARDRIHLRWPALRRDAPHVCSATDRARGTHCSCAVVRAAVLDYAASQSLAREPY